MTYKLYNNDCLGVMKGLSSSSVNLVYLDPPFFTQKIHKLRARDRKREFSFTDIWNSHQEYVEFLAPRLEQVHRVLDDTGTMFFHCDRNASHIVRFILDEIFGQGNFRSEIIWHYRRWSNSQRALLPAHQTIYFYSKTENYRFNSIYQDYSPTTNIDQILQKRRRDEWGKAVYALDEDGVPLSNGAKKGVPLSDVWDIPYLNPKAQERTGYPTQKPVLLLERIIELCTNPGDLILDPFCGSGTALVAAEILQRDSIGVDISPDAIEIAQSRLNQPFKTESHLLVKGRDSYHTADEEAITLLKDLDIVPVQRNKGIDAFLKEPVGGRLVPIRVQRRHELVIDAANQLYRAGLTKQALLMLLVVTSPASEFELTIGLPQEVIVVESTALAIKQQVSRFKIENQIL